MFYMQSKSDIFFKNYKSFLNHKKKNEKKKIRILNDKGIFVIELYK